MEFKLSNMRSLMRLHNWRRPTVARLLIEELKELSKEPSVKLCVPDEFVKLIASTEEAIYPERILELMEWASKHQNKAMAICGFYGKSDEGKRRRVVKELATRFYDPGKIIKSVEKIYDERRERGRIYASCIRRGVPYVFRNRKGAKLTFRAQKKKGKSERGRCIFDCVVRNGKRIRLVYPRYTGLWYEIIRDLKGGKFEPGWLEEVTFDGKTYMNDWDNQRNDRRIKNILSALGENIDPNIRLLIGDNKKEGED